MGTSLLASMDGAWPADRLSSGVPVMDTGRRRSIAIIATAIGLMMIGAVMTFSASIRLDPVPADVPWWKLRVVRQMMFVASGLAAMLVMTRVPYRIWTAGRGLLAMAVFVLTLGVAGLVFVPGIGVKVNEAYRWIRVGPESLGLQFQPSELVKVFLPILLAVWMTRGMPSNDRIAGSLRDGLSPDLWRNIRSFHRGFLPAVLAIGAAVAAVGLEDFGTAVLMAAVGGAMLLMGGARWLHLLGLVLPAVPAFGYLLFSRAHRLERLMTFLNIWEDPEDKGYQAVQSLNTIVSGGFWGRGLGRGFVKGYLPEARTDFIFAVICEELGVIGAMAVIGLLIVLLWQCRGVIRECADPLGRLMAFGIGMTIGLQAAINIAVVTVSVPTKGISLPLVSAGGSGAIFMGAMVGVLASIPRSAGGSER